MVTTGLIILAIVANVALAINYIAALINREYYEAFNETLEYVLIIDVLLFISIVYSYIFN